MASRSLADFDIFRIKIESPTSEFYMTVEETTKVKVLMATVKSAWGPEYFTLHHDSELMESHKKLAAYGVREGSVIKVQYYADSP